MGLFSKTFFNKYAVHDDVLNVIARETAFTALRQIQRSACDDTYCMLGCDNLALDNRPDDVTNYGEKYSSCCLKWRDYGMENVPQNDSAMFFKAFLPYLEKHLKSNLNRYMPSAICVSAIQTMYPSSSCCDTDADMINVIKISVTWPDETSMKPLKKW